MQAGPVRKSRGRPDPTRVLRAEGKRKVFSSGRQCGILGSGSDVKEEF